MQPLQDKTEALGKTPIPQTKKYVWAFLDQASYYCLFIPQVAELATPLMDLTRTSAPKKVRQTWDHHSVLKNKRHFGAATCALVLRFFATFYFIHRRLHHKFGGRTASKFSKNRASNPLLKQEASAT